MPKAGAVGSELDAEAAKEAQAGDTSATKQWITGLTLLFVVVVMALDLKNFPASSRCNDLGALFLVITKCIGEKDAYKGIDWVTIFLFAGMLPVATAMDKSGAGKLIANWVVGA